MKFASIFFYFIVFVFFLLFQTFVSFGLNLEGVNKENEDMPDYPEEESPTIKGAKNMANMGSATPKIGGWGFVKTVGDFISNSFYW